MPAKCVVCVRADVEAINRDLAVEEMPGRAVAEKYGITYSSVWRHKVGHLGLAAKGERFRENAHAVVASVLAGADLVSEVRTLRQRAERLGAEAEVKADLRTALLAIRELTRLIELQGRLTLDNAAGRAADVSHHPVWRLLASDIMRALAPYPEALDAVQRALLARLGVSQEGGSELTHPVPGG